MKSYLIHFFKTHWDALLASAFAFIWIAFYTAHSGIGISPDSVAYLSTANHFSDSFQFTDYNNLPLVNFPLGYPLLLGLVKLVFFTEVITAAPILNSLLLAAVLYTSSYLLLHAKIKNGFFRLLILCLILSSPGILEVYTMLWSETVFILLVLIFIVAFHQYLLTEKKNWLLIAGTIAAITCSIRYVGITLLITGGLLILFYIQFNWRTKLKHIGLLVLVGCSLPLLNIIRNKLLTQTFAGVRQSSLKTFQTNLQDFINVLGYWFPNSENDSSTTLLIIGVILLFIVIVVLLYRLIQQQFFASVISLLSLFVLVYGAFILFIASISRFETLSSRLLIPLYIPLFILIAHCFYQWMVASRRYKKVFILLVFSVWYAIGANHHYQAHLFNWEGIGYAGIPGYTDDLWRGSPLLQFMKTHHSSYQAPIYSNANDAVFFLANIKANPLPHKDLQQEIDPFLNHQNIYLVWFEYGKNPDLIDDEYIRAHFKQTKEWQFKDGSIFYFTPTNK
ncbi:MAG: hypothetical protein B7Y11_03925 [Sphingobacteriia bacterium 24-36-13]|jgi:hypothetical protein|uniref:hypothetical protein n=1 Tax=Sediminibacterium sp. TaxID=1917865 RepID=UPI000BD98B43|nr:hypothetical protein [Sediminibacterium sp.]OYZ54814.1 MAG: hypothetical protein B7Y11_03925 [Sphingobacteriia bacterium 24-36-13]OZA63620.1 MAG: hypothetical protein B7X68_10100 [Sphingobacteriia bacterium 39-36-14]HQS24100.1 hypothetical protein [Sediminibacterium sp.]HQS35154.1 hypothetical protein [Sediminibacterium sp.]